MILSAYTGDNSDIIARVAEMYFRPGDVVADVTYGRGNFWKQVDLSKYDFRPTDLEMGVDFRSLPYGDAEIGVVVLDPPYMHGGATVKKSINDCYKNQNGSHESVMRLYVGGFLEAARVLKQGGLLVVKCQDEIESGRQHWSHVELMQVLDVLGFLVVDMFVLVQDHQPAMREKYQNTARKNHSYVLVARFRR